jgi:hypothetical protein
MLQLHDRAKADNGFISDSPIGHSWVEQSGTGIEDVLKIRL